MLDHIFDRGEERSPTNNGRTGWHFSLLTERRLRGKRIKGFCQFIAATEDEAAAISYAWIDPSQINVCPYILLSLSSFLESNWTGIGNLCSFFREMHIWWRCYYLGKVIVAGWFASNIVSGERKDLVGGPRSQQIFKEPRSDCKLTSTLAIKKSRLFLFALICCAWKRWCKLVKR